MQRSSGSRAEITVSVHEIMREKESCCCNWVIHNLAEPDEDVTDNKDRIMKDKSMVYDLCDVIGVEVDVH